MKTSLCRVAPFVLLVLTGGTGCTTLGPVPGMTAVNAVPAPGADVEAEAAIVPGYYLSSTTQEQPDRDLTAQASAMFEPNELIHVEGFSVGARAVGGGDSSAYLEPMVRYRRWIDASRRLAFAGVAYGTHAGGSSSGASYSMTHLGGEAGLDLRVTPTSSWAELHLSSGGSVSGLFASGDYCTNTNGWGTDCPDGGPADTYAEVSGAFPAIYGGASLDFARHLPIFLHGVRLAVFVAGGQMPAVRYGAKASRRGWDGGGLSLTVGVGAARSDAN